MRRSRLDGLNTVKSYRSVWVTGVEEGIPPRRGTKHATLRETSFGDAFEGIRVVVSPRNAPPVYVQAGKNRDCCIPQAGL
jgi:hypothetical protein